MSNFRIKSKGGGIRGTGSKSTEELYQYQASIRAKSTVRSLVLQNGLKYLWTLTYSAEIERRDTASDDFKKFMKRLKRAFKGKIYYVAVMEIQKEREKKYGIPVIHFHFATDCRIPHQLVEKAWGNGFVFVEKFSGDLSKVASYMAKYMTKDIDDDSVPRSKGEKRYFCSRGLKKPEKYTSLIQGVDLEHLENKAEVKVEYENGTWYKIQRSALDLPQKAAHLP